MWLPMVNRIAHMCSQQLYHTPSGDRHTAGAYSCCLTTHTPAGILACSPALTLQQLMQALGVASVGACCDAVEVSLELTCQADKAHLHARQRGLPETCGQHTHTSTATCSTQHMCWQWLVTSASFQEPSRRTELSGRTELSRGAGRHGTNCCVGQHRMAACERAPQNNPATHKTGTSHAQAAMPLCSKLAQPWVVQYPNLFLTCAVVVVVPVCSLECCGGR